jgi:dihydroorotate dehydrogenase (NAD+) catalytic subunit
MGGILTGDDAFQFILAGASAVAIGTANFHDPSALVRIQNELSVILAERGFDSLQDAIGFAHRKD